MEKALNYIRYNDNYTKLINVGSLKHTRTGIWNKKKQNTKFDGTDSI